LLFSISDDVDVDAADMKGDVDERDSGSGSCRGEDDEDANDVNPDAVCLKAVGDIFSVLSILRRSVDVDIFTLILNESVSLCFLDAKYVDMDMDMVLLSHLLPSSRDDSILDIYCSMCKSSVKEGMSSDTVQYRTVQYVDYAFLHSTPLISSHLVTRRTHHWDSVLYCTLYCIVLHCIALH
jgi:hypothetical protein